MVFQCDEYTELGQLERINDKVYGVYIGVNYIAIILTIMLLILVF